MIGLGEKIVVTILIGAAALLVLFTRGRRGPGIPLAFAVLIDWRLIRQLFFRADDSWRPVAKGLLLAMFGVALICVWIA